MSDQIVLSPKIYTIYKFFEKSRNQNWKENPFKNFKKINNFNVKIARNISNLNFYLIDIPLSNKIKPSYVIYYLKNIEYRNVFSADIIKFILKKQIDENHWIEEEIYHGASNIFKCHSSKFSILFFNDTESTNNVSETKYFTHYTILKDKDSGSNILRIELVLNNLDLDQEIDIYIYTNMISNILKATYSKFKIDFNVNSEKIIEIEKSVDLDNNDKQTQTLESLLEKDNADKSVQISLSDNISDIENDYNKK
jgi:hypothetical protein